MITVAPSTSYEVTLEIGVSGLVGTLQVGTYDGDTATQALSSANINEISTSGVYVATRTSPSVAGQYVIIGSLDGTLDPDQVLTDELLVTSTPSFTAPTGTAYVTAATLKATLNMSDYDFADDDFAVAVEAASRSVDAECGRRFYLDADNTQIRYYTPDTTTFAIIDDIVDVAGVAIDVGGTGSFTSLSASTYVAAPFNALADGRPYTNLKTRSGTYFSAYERSLRVTGQFGWPNVPSAVAEATTIYASRLLKRAREAPFGIQALGIDGVAARISRTDPDLMLLLQQYVRRRTIL